MPADAELSEVVALMAAAATATGRPLDDPQLAADAAKLAAVALGSSLGQWLGLMRNRPAEGDDDNALRLQRYTVDQVVSVQAIQRDGAMSAKAQIVTRAMRDGEMRDEKPMTTEFLDDPIAKEVAGRAKALIGHPAVVYRHNEAAPKGYRAKHGDNAGEVVTQFRRIVWIDAADPPGARKLAARDAGRTTPVVPPAGVPSAEAAERVQRIAAPPPVEQAPAAPPVAQPVPTLSPGPFGKTLAIVDGSDADDVTPLDMIPGSWDAFMADWQALGGDGQAVLRNANKAAKSAGQPSVPVLHRPAVVGDVRLLAQFHQAALAGAAS